MIDQKYLDQLAKIVYTNSLVLPAGKSYNKVWLAEAECVFRIEKLNKEAESIGISKEHLKGIYQRSVTYYRENNVGCDFLHLYEYFLKKEINRFRWNKNGIAISIVDTIKLNDVIKKRDRYLSRDWIGINKIIKR